MCSALILRDGKFIWVWDFPTLAKAHYCHSGNLSDEFTYLLDLKCRADAVTRYFSGLRRSASVKGVVGAGAFHLFFASSSRLPD